MLVHKLHEDEIDVTVVDSTGKHVYQPGWLYVPFGEEETKNLVKSERKLLTKASTWSPAQRRGSSLRQNGS
ncbi:MAG: hypothetical protein R2845_00945 [Thermomicrobiales bacterium]